MLRYKLTDKGMSELQGFVLEHGSEDHMAEYVNEAESIASHAFKADMPALLTIESYTEGCEVYLSLERDWFEVAA